MIRMCVVSFPSHPVCPQHAIFRLQISHCPPANRLLACWTVCLPARLLAPTDSRATGTQAALRGVQHQLGAMEEEKSGLHAQVARLTEELRKVCPLPPHCAHTCTRKARFRTCPALPRHPQPSWTPPLSPGSIALRQCVTRFSHTYAPPPLGVTAQEASRCSRERAARMLLVADMNELRTVHGGPGLMLL